MKSFYLDNNATTQPAPEVVVAMQQCMGELWANPSSVHRAGQAVRHQVELARSKVARLLHCKERELIFTSGGTEANNLALGGLFSQDLSAGETGKPAVLLTTTVEHSAIRQPAEAWAARGVKVVYLAINGAGQVEIDALREALDEHGTSGKVVLVSLQWANNETGAIQPMDAVAGVMAQTREGMRAESGQGRGAKIYWHVDATQAVGKLPVHLDKVPVDLLTLAAHKFHGPKGIGALFVRQGIRLKPQLLGGPQERDRRGGTENTPGIIGLGVAAELAATFLSDTVKIETFKGLRDRLDETMVKAMPDTVVHGRSAQRLWNTTNLGFPRLEAEAILLGLSERGVYASAGAACSSGSLEPSPVLLAMGIPPEVAHGSVRFSLSRFTTEAEIDEAIELIPQVVGRLRQVLPMGNRF